MQSHYGCHTLLGSLQELELFRNSGPQGKYPIVFCRSEEHGRKVMCTNSITPNSMPKEAAQKVVLKRFNSSDGLYNA